MQRCYLKGFRIVKAFSGMKEHVNIKLQHVNLDAGHDVLPLPD